MPKPINRIPDAPFSYPLYTVWVSEEMVDKLIASGVARTPWNIQASITVSYEWNLYTNQINIYPNTLASEEDELAEQLMLIPTAEARLEYLNYH